jgi:dienelactone hydrolase
MRLVKGLWALALVTIVCLGTAQAAPAAVQPIENYIKWPTIERVVVSPSGKRMAVLLFGPDGLRKLGVMSLDPIGEARVVGGFSDADVQTVRWVNDNRLVYETYPRGPVATNGSANTYAVNADGSEERHLISWLYDKLSVNGPSRITSRVLPYGWFVHSAVDDGGDDIHVYKLVRDGIDDVKEAQLARLNTRTGMLQNLSSGMPDDVYRWSFDAKREPRMVSAQKAGRGQVYWLNRDKVWQKVADFDALSKDAFRSWFVDSDDQAYVLGRGAGDTEGLYKFDVVTVRIEPEPLVNLRGFDLNPSPVTDQQTRKLLGFHFKTDRPMSYWFDSKMAQIQKSMDSALPGRNNHLHCGRCESTRFFVVESSSDRQPGEYFLFDREKASLQRIGASRPWIDEEKQGRRTFHRVAARDGLPLPVYVTHPAGSDPKQALPAVMLVHGGPWVRGADTDWDAEAQFLASRGYRVLQPEFRGSAGYGYKHFQAGWKQWGGGMQDDLVDTLQWAAKQGLVDPSRVCIMGASYGGFAAMMGPITNPGLYRCAISYAGVMDIELMGTISWSDMSRDYLKYGMPAVVGDLKKDAALIASASPLNRVKEIKVPVLLGHGALDRRVPVKHAQEFVSAARSAGVDIEEVIYKDEGHGFFHVADHLDFYQRVERFLEKSLKAPQ